VRVGARRTVTVLFSDVAGSTALGESLDPEAARRLLASWFDDARVILERHGGTVEKFIGDAVMAVFGLPRLHEDDALRAVRAAADLRRLDVPFQTRTAVNTGEVAVAEGETLVIGDAVNVAARLEQAAQPGEILLGEATYRLVPAAVEVEPVEPLGLKGKSEPVAAYRLLRVLPGAEPFPRRLDTLLVGREEELARLLETYRRAQDTSAAEAVTVVGEPGIGKSRLVRELTHRIAPEVTVLEGRCLPFGEGITYWPLVDMIREAADPEMRARLTELLEGDAEAELVAQRVATAVGAAEGAASSDEIAWAVRRLLERLSRERPLAVVVDDAHWAEPTLLDLLEHLVYLWRGGALLLVCLARPELLVARPAWPGLRLLLEPLTHGQSTELVRRLGGGPEERIAATAQGNPLFIEQLQAMIASDATDGNGTIPPTIQALLAARLDQLDPDERATIEAASVVGKEFWAGAVRTLTPSDVQVGSALVVLIRQNLIRPQEDPAFPGEEAFAFVHLLVRDAAYSGMTKERRAALHEQLGSWLEERDREHGRERDEIVGYHLEQAFGFRRELGEDAQGLAAAATERLAAAGRRAQRRGDLRAAVSLLSRAAEMVADQDVLLELGFALFQAGSFSHAQRTLWEARKLADEHGDAGHAARAELMSLHARMQSDPSVGREEIVSTAERARAILESAGDERGLADAWFVLSVINYFGCHFGAAAEAAERALTHARRARDERLEADLVHAISTSLSVSAHVDDAIARTEALLAEAAGRPQIEADLLLTLGLLNGQRGRFEEADELMNRADSIFAELGQRRRRATVARRRGDVRWLAGELSSAEDTLREALALFEELGDTSRRSGAAAELADVIYRRGGYEEADELTTMSERLASEHDVESQAHLRLVRAKVRARAGEHAEAEALARKALELADGTDFIFLRGIGLLDLAEVLALAGRSDEAVDAADRARAVFAESGYLALLPFADQARTAV
jgi:class 3 adenylate cyclase/tetratricopeptide (TPR) repeat protein